MFKCYPINYAKFHCTGFLRTHYFSTESIKMAGHSKKLIIWDLDGVLADTERMWMYNRMRAVNKLYGFSWDFETTVAHFDGRNGMDVDNTLKSLGIEDRSAFWKYTRRLDEKIFQNGIKATYGIKRMLQNINTPFCIATGDTLERTRKKIAAMKIDKYFSTDNIFTAVMVDKGKPAPDVYLLAAEKCGVPPENCLVVEDSVVCFKAAQQTSMKFVAFIKNAFNRNYSENKITELGISDIFTKSKDLFEFIKKECGQ